MIRTINRFLPVVLAGMFMFAGCAKQDVVMKDEPLAPTVAKPAGTAPSKPAATAEKAQGKPIVATNVTSTPPGTRDLKKSQQSNEVVASADMRKALERIYFDFDSSTLSETARKTLARDFEVLKQTPLTRIRIEGHCDERGSDEYNLALGEQRAHAAFRYLTTCGVSAGRLSTISYGKEKPADPGHDEAAWARNRRDEFVISK